MDIKDAIGKMLHISRNLNRGHPNVTSEHFNNAHDRVEGLIDDLTEQLSRTQRKLAEVHRLAVVTDESLSPVAAVCALFATVSLTPANRGRVHRWLGSLGSNASKQQQAAAVAALLGGSGRTAASALARRGTAQRARTRDGAPQWRQRAV